MPETKITLKQRFATFRKFLKSFKKKKTLTREVIEIELDAFMRKNNYTLDDLNNDPDTFEDEFARYLQDQGYPLKSGELSFNMESRVKKIPKKITKISEELNEYEWDFPIFTDTTKMLPGFVCYVVVQVAPTDKKPYVTYKPAARVITQIHDSGVNQGTTFFTYSHQVVRTFIDTKPTVISEEEVIYSPLTKEHAEYMCKLLNAQSKKLYKECLKQQNTMSREKIIGFHKQPRTN